MGDSLSAGSAIITGAVSGVGRATALYFARDGCRKLVLTDLSVDGLAETKRSILEQYSNATVEVKQTDFGNEASVDDLYAFAVTKFGRIDFVANVANYEHPSQLVTELNQDEFKKSYEVNLRGVLLSQRAALRQMLKQDVLSETKTRGSIVNVGSLHSTAALPKTTIYSATKGGVWGITRGDAFDYGHDKIRLNMVSPGIIRTSSEAAVAEKYENFTPLQRLAEPEDVANAIAFLASSRAALITGAFLPVDGGLYIATGPQ